jgi:hypothetical protein
LTKHSVSYEDANLYDSKESLIRRAHRNVLEGPGGQA